MESSPIDFVITWVNGEDAQWRARRDRDLQDAPVYPSLRSDRTTLGSSEQRYRDWDFFRYWFRGVESFAPWVRKIHFVTEGHLPAWLNVDHPKLNIVKHSDYIPSEYLPVYNSHPIELNLHRIDGLSDRFVYFNDDMFLLGPTKESDFFRGSLPRRHAVLNAISPCDDDFFHILGNNVAVINRNFTIQSARRHPFRWLNPAYGVHMLRNVPLLAYPRFVGFFFDHAPSPMLKSTYEEVWEREWPVMDRTSRSKFRSPFDVNQWLIQWWDIASGQMAVDSVGSKYRYLRTAELAELVGKGDRIDLQRGKFLIVFDDSEFPEGREVFENVSRMMCEAFERVLPIRSGFELDDEVAVQSDAG